MGKIDAGRTCWAAPLGNCNSKISREHYVSKAIFPDMKEVTVQGLSWCKDQPETVGLASLTAKILCASHNSQLSILDSAAQKAAAAFIKIIESAANPPHAFNIEINIDGDLLERWFLKTTLNLLAVEKFASLNTTEERPYLVNAAFGLAELPGKAGLYSAAVVGECLEYSPRFTSLPIYHPDRPNELGIVLYNFYGSSFLFSLYEELVPFDFLENLQLGEEWKSRGVVRHPMGISFNLSNNRKYSLNIEWRDRKPASIYRIT